MCLCVCLCVYAYVCVCVCVCDGIDPDSVESAPSKEFTAARMKVEQAQRSEMPAPRGSMGIPNTGTDPRSIL